jgi:hypothetical protein
MTAAGGNHCRQYKPLDTRYLWKVPPDPRQMDADKHQSASLTLAGFCFTSLSLLVSFFKKRSLPNMQRD